MAKDKDKLIVYGKCKRTTKPGISHVYYIGEIEDDRAMVNVGEADMIHIDEKYSSLKKWRDRRNIVVTESKPRGR